jgi:large subunit ribosomal protein L29
MAEKKKTQEVKTIDQLREEVAAKQSDLLEARRGHAAGELANPRYLSSLRKDIARLNTAIREQELSAKEDK